MESAKPKGGVFLGFGCGLLALALLILLFGGESDVQAGVTALVIGLVLLIIGLVRRSNSKKRIEAELASRVSAERSTSSGGSGGAPAPGAGSGFYRSPGGERTPIPGGSGFYRSPGGERTPTPGASGGSPSAAARPVLEGDLLRRTGAVPQQSKPQPGPAAADVPRDGVSMDQKFAAATGSWVCPQCETINAKENGVCMACGCPRS